MKPDRYKLSVPILLMTCVLCSASDSAWAKKKTSHKLRKKPPVVETYAGRPEVDVFAQELAKQGVDAELVSAALAQARKLESVRNAVRPFPPGVKKNWQAYRSRFVDSEHVQAGLTFWSENQITLARAEERYGIPQFVILGILGVETLYGGNTGNYRVIDSLATLSFDYPEGGKDRSPYFRGQLGEFFRWCARMQCEPLSVLGSYAGAVGMPQFMPENIDKFGVDFDGDGRVDLQTPADAIGSIARFLASHGWVPNLAPSYPVNIEHAQLGPLLEPDIIPTFADWQMRALGAIPLVALPPLEKYALVELKNGDNQSDYLLGSRNFFVLTRYNRSSYYATAVIDLGMAVEQAKNEMIAGRMPTPYSQPAER